MTLKQSRLDRAIMLRDAALTLLSKKGKPSQARDSIMFEQHTAQTPPPRLSLVLSKHPRNGRAMLSVWANLKDKHAKVLNIEWLGEDVSLVSFRRGDWESELLAMGRAIAVH